MTKYFCYLNGQKCNLIPSDRINLFWSFLQFSTYQNISDVTSQAWKIIIRCKCYSPQNRNFSYFNTTLSDINMVHLYISTKGKYFIVWKFRLISLNLLNVALSSTHANCPNIYNYTSRPRRTLTSEIGH